MKSILVATDYSPAANNAAEYAALLAKQAGAKLYLLHVYMVPTPISEAPYFFIPFEELEQTNEKRIKKEAHRLYELAGVEVQPVTGIGFSGDVIIDIAEEREVDLIVVGMKGDTDSIDTLMGSTTDSITRHSPVPVLAIPTDIVFEPIKIVTFATGYHFEMTAERIAVLKKILSLFSAHLNILNVKKPGAELKPAQQVCHQKLKELLAGTSYSFHIYTEPNKDIEKGISGFLTENPSQLLTMVSHRHTFFERFFGTIHTHEMLQITNIPLLVLEDK